MRRILVTGATGFLGRHVLEALKKSNAEVFGVARSVANFEAAQSKKVKLYSADLLNDDARRAVLNDIRPTHLLHLGWCTTPGSYWQSDENLSWVAASLHLIREFRDGGGFRVVVGGSCAEYEWGAPILDEKRTECRPATLYGASKDSLRRLLDAYADVVSLSYAWGRVFYLYGPGESRGRLISDAITSLLSGKNFLTTDGLQAIDYLHVADAARALVLLLETQVSGPVNVASGNAVLVRDMLNIVGLETGRPDLLDFGKINRKSSDTMVIQGATGRLFREVAFTPTIGARDGIAETVGWWRAKLGPSR